MFMSMFVSRNIYIKSGNLSLQMYFLFWKLIKRLPEDVLHFISFVPS